MLLYTDEYWNDVEKVAKCIPDIDKLRGRTILVTGATGMIGSAVTEILFHMNRTRNFHMNIILAGRSRSRIIKRFQSFVSENDFGFSYYDADTGTLEMGSVQPDFIIHGASPADPYSFSTRPVETMLANINGLSVLLDILKNNKSGRLLYLSSSEVYGRFSRNQPFSEGDYGYVDILNFRACYPSAKRAAETLCSSYKKEYGVDFVVARPGHIYGPSIKENDSRVSAEFTRCAVNHKPLVLKSSGLQLRSYCYTLDCGSAILSILLNGYSGNAYNISNKVSIVTIRKLAELFSLAAHVPVIFKDSSNEEKKVFNMMDNSSLNSNRLESLGWKPCFDIQRGINATLSYYR